MQKIRIINQITAFLLEICMFAILGFIGFQTGEESLSKYVLAVVFPSIAIALWYFFAAPHSDYRLGLTWRILFEIILFSITAFLLSTTGYQSLALRFWIIVILNEFIAYLFETLHVDGIEGKKPGE